MITGKHLSRRTLLRGPGVVASRCRCSIPCCRHSRRRRKAPLRMMFTYVPNGIIMKDWTPTTDGSRRSTFPRILQPMAPYRDKMMVVTGLMQNNGYAHGDGPAIMRARRHLSDRRPSPRRRRARIFTWAFRWISGGAEGRRRDALSLRWS